MDGLNRFFRSRHAASGPLVDVLAEGSGIDTTSVSGREEQSVFRCARKLRGYSPALTSDRGHSSRGSTTCSMGRLKPWRLHIAR
jgi:hypothetical protein